MSQTGDDSSSIFICYRRQDSADSVDRICEKLAAIFPGDEVYRDLDAIPLGVDFITDIAEALARCEVVLVVIGPGWLDIRDESGDRRRLDDPADQVRVEIEAALNKPDVVVIPVLVREARMPRREELPVPLQRLTRLNAAIVRPNPHFHGDAERLLTALRDALKKARAAREARVRQAQQAAEALAAQKSEVRLLALSEEDWQELLEALEARQVISVLGPMLGTIEVAGRREALPRHLAAAVATRLGLEPIPDDSRQPLQSVALRFAEKRGSAHRFREALKAILDHVAFAPTEAVAELTLVEPLRLFVTTHLDQMLESALRAARGAEPISINFSPECPNDLPVEDAHGEDSIVFHLTGSAKDPWCGAAITVADWMEFSAALMSWGRQPRRLLNALDGCDLLFLGGGHPTGFVRSIIHLASVGRGRRSVRAWIGASALDGDSDLPNLLRARGSHDRLFDDAGGEPFVSELRRRWGAWQGNTAQVKTLASTAPNVSRSVLPSLPVEKVYEQKSDRSPWIGLRPFSQTESSFFYGREREIADLLRLLRYERVTVLFGRSGLGKTSLINAGLIPELRAAGFIPVSLRLDWSSSAVSFREQVFLALSDALAAAGIDRPPPNASLSLWSYFHLCSTSFSTTSGTEFQPILIFDQFEEVFTLGQGTASATLSGNDALAELGDLVENRLSPKLRAELNEGSLAPNEFDFERIGPPVLISVREDFLPELDSCREIMPTMYRGRFRLLPLNGRSALAAITMPEPNAIEPDVAEQIVRLFSRGGTPGSELETIEINPSMLALFLYEVNQRRLAQGRANVDSSLVSQLNSESVLDRFYVDCFRGLPAAVREFVEDRSVSRNGFRMRIEVSQFTEHLEQLGVEKDALEQLVQSRLLDIDQMAGVRYVQLTHDMLASIVRASRERRLTRFEQTPSRLLRRILRIQGSGSDGA